MLCIFNELLKTFTEQIIETFAARHTRERGYPYF